MQRRRVSVQFRALLSLMCLAAVLVCGPAAPASAGTLSIANGTFSNGTASWGTSGGDVDFVVAGGGRSGDAARLEAGRSLSYMALRHTSATVSSTSVGASYTMAAWVRAPQGMRVAVRIRETNSSTSRYVDRSIWLPAYTWTKVSVTTTAKLSGSRMGVSVLGLDVPAGAVLRVDDVTGYTTATTDGGTSTCTFSRRGIPECGAYFGAAVGLNEDPSLFESKVGGRLAVHRLFYRSGDVAEAVRTARDDLAKGRVPWISFTFPYSWSDMAAGRGDAWARNLAAQFAQLDGPVWVAFHHEPENDSGDVLQWRRAQERLAPIVRSTAPNVAYTVILMGYHQLYGRTDVYGLDRIWPRTTIDVLGIDPYNFYGAPNKTRDSSANLVKEYFEPIGAWARANSVEWGVAETGYTDRAFAEDPYWLQNTFKGLRANGGVAMSYFNAAPSSVSGDWLLDTSARLSAFASTLQMTTRYRR